MFSESTRRIPLLIRITANGTVKEVAFLSLTTLLLTHVVKRNRFHKANRSKNKLVTGDRENAQRMSGGQPIQNDVLVQEGNAIGGITTAVTRTVGGRGYSSGWKDVCEGRQP